MNSDVTTWALPEGALARFGRGDMLALAFSPNKTHLADGDILAQIPFLNAAKFAYSPSGQYVACGGDVGEADVLLWDIERCETYMRLPLPHEDDWTHALAFSRCGKYLACGSGWNRETKQVPLQLWEVATGKNLATFYGHTTDIQGLAFSPDSTLLASASFDGTILLWGVS